jgi:hypothetical protein
LIGNPRAARCDILSGLVIDSAVNG